MLKKVIYALLVTILIAGALYLFLKKRQPPGYRIVLITIDTLRADHLGCYGYPRDTSPFIDSLAKRGILFQRAFCPMATTSPSHASIFTSLYPIQHNVLKNGHKLSDGFITLAELLREMNYKTAGVVSTKAYFKPANIDQGFEYFNDKGYRGEYRVAKKTIDVAIQWLDKLQERDSFFLWIHLYDPHTPCKPPKKFLECFTKQPEKEKKSFVRFLLDEHHIDLNFYLYKNKPELMLQTINNYDGEILFVDTEISRFHEHYVKKGLNSNTLWIITSDHGEGLGNHGWYLHGKHIYNEQLYVPLILCFSSGLFQGISVDRIVELVDIPPTILELIGSNLKGLRRQIKTIQGSSLVPLLEKHFQGYPKKYSFAQRREFNPEKRPNKIIPERTNYEDGKKYTLQDENYKYIYRTKGDDEFFNLKKDPYELNNIAGSNSEEEKKFKAMLIGKIKEFEKEKSMKSESIDQKTIERLKSLGYVQ